MRWPSMGSAGLACALLIVELGFGAGRRIYAQVEGSRPLSFGAARALAEGHAPEVALARRRDEIVRAEVSVAGALANPTIGLSTARETARLGTSLSLPLPLRPKASVRSAVVVGDVLADCAFGMATVTDDHVIEAAAPNGSDHTLGEGICLG